jgi:competence protein ComEA
VDDRSTTAVLRSAIADRLPLGLRAGRFGMDIRSVVVIALASLLGATLGVVYLVRSRPAQIDVPPAVVAVSPAVGSPNQSPSGDQPSGGAAAGGVTTGPLAAGGELIVDIEGKVRHPGIVRVPKGSRVIDALEAAGGALPGAQTSGLNLARVLTDGEQILVGVPPPAGAAQTTASAGGMPAGPLDLNSATLDQLEELPGVGPVLAQRILDYRLKQGRFTSVDELRAVSGIGDQRFAELKDLVRV